MAEVSEHTREVEPGDPFPGVMVLARARWSRRSKRKDPAAELWQSRRADHNLTHASLRLVLTYASIDSIILSNHQTPSRDAARRLRNTRFHQSRHRFASRCHGSGDGINYR